MGKDIAEGIIYVFIYLSFLCHVLLGSLTCVHDGGNEKSSFIICSNYYIHQVAARSLVARHKAEYFDKTSMTTPGF